MTNTAGERHGWKWLTVLVLLGLLAGTVWAISWQQAAGADGGALTSNAARWATKLLLVVFSLGAWFLTQSLIGSRPVKDGEIGDLVHVLTASWNAYLQVHPRAANGVLIASSIGIDTLGLFLIGAGLFGHTLRPFVGLLLLFAFRQFCQALCALPTPPNMIWRSPGFPSLLVTYGVGNDFFISGHTAIAVLGAVEACRLLPPVFGVVAVVVALLEATTVLVLRAHYTMDILAAITAAFCAAGLASYVCLALGL